MINLEEVQRLEAIYLEAKNTLLSEMRETYLDFQIKRDEIKITNDAINCVIEESLDYMSKLLIYIEDDKSMQGDGKYSASNHVKEFNEEVELLNKLL